MNRDLFWLTKDQFSRLKPLLPTDTRGKPRVDGQVNLPNPRHESALHYWHVRVVGLHSDNE